MGLHALFLFRSQRRHELRARLLHCAAHLLHRGFMDAQDGLLFARAQRRIESGGCSAAIGFCGDCKLTHDVGEQCAVLRGERGERLGSLGMVNLLHLLLDVSEGTEVPVRHARCTRPWRRLILRETQRGQQKKTEYKKPDKLFHRPDCSR